MSRYRQSHYRRVFRLRTILLVVMLGVLALPMGSLYLFRVYENELVRQTEIELIAQSAVLAASFRQLMGVEEKLSKPYYQPILPSLDLYVDPILPRRPEVRASRQMLDPVMWDVGQQMQPIVMSAQRTTLAGFRILDNQGIVIAGRNELGASLAHIPEVAQALNGNYKAAVRERISDEPTPPLASISRGTSIRIFTAFPIKNGNDIYGVIYLSRTPQNILKHLYDIRGKMVLVVISLLMITFAVVFFIAHHLVWPIRDLIAQTKQVARGEKQTVETLRYSGTYELAELSESFAQMSKTLHQRSTYIQQFASHVSHEFKTPITSMQGALELLQEHGDDMSVEQRQKFLANMNHDTERMKRLVNRLLELARADALQPNQAQCEIAPLLKRLIHYYQDLGLTLQLDNICDAQVHIAEDALESIIRNLCDNSLQHHASSIALNCKTSQDTIKLTVHDNGEGISKANRERIFTPFFTTKREQGGTGLGLDIVKSLLTNWGGDIQLLETETGCCFEIQLKRVSNTVKPEK